jgi:hypothetical protein
MNRKHMDWATFRVVVQRRGMCAMKAPLSLVSFGVGSRVTRGKNVLWVC